MDNSRLEYLIKMSDRTRWPRFEMVIYKCGVSLEECRELFGWLDANNRKVEADCVALGAMNYFGSFDRQTKIKPPTD